MQRTLTLQTTQHIGEVVKLQGWVDTKRDHGKLTFIDLRDRTGTVQCVGYQKMGELTPESVIEVVGQVKERPENMINAESATGAVEIDVREYTVLGKAGSLPIPIDTDGSEIAEEMRLKYRYLDLRRERMQKNVRVRSELTRALSEALYEREFVNIETPMLTKSTKEGARDFVVPARLQPGLFYALPQSPQQYKQLLMTAGFERYFQVARCIRDEDLRSDRGFEFTQLDLEMSFPESRESVMELVETVVKQAVTSVGGKMQQDPFPVVSYPEALEKYGADKFDLRTEQEKKNGVLAFAWVVDFPFFKKVDAKDVAEVRDGKSGWTFTHNPFSSPIPEHIEWLKNKEHIGEIITAQYDLVCNGYEVGGGSIRAHSPELLTAVFEIMGYSSEEITEGVGHMLEAFGVGTPPHGGIALGLDRLAMLLTGETSLKESIAFPMTGSGKTAVMQAPAPISDEQLRELHLATQLPKK
ncbi:MAG: aspartate--tRNA ligase [Pseudomonadales bacterium]|nr:aspartate--tRNA ligase [Candidatus Woesebacteria bacterium]MCB9802138.1 aspartate--tRNA ligase [Pseudomonadales bacterium]